MNALKPFLKALAPAVLGAVGALANALADGTFDTKSVESAAGGLVIAVVVYFVPNLKVKT